MCAVVVATVRNVFKVKSFPFLNQNMTDLCSPICTPQHSLELLWMGKTVERYHALRVFYGFTRNSHLLWVAELIGKGKTLRAKPKTSLIANASYKLWAGTCNALTFQWGNRAASLTDRLRKACGPLPYVEVWLAHRLSRPSQPSHLITLEAWAWGLLSVNGVVGVARVSGALLSRALWESTCATMQVLKCLWWHRANHWGEGIVKTHLLCHLIWLSVMSSRPYFISAFNNVEPTRGCVPQGVLNQLPVGYLKSFFIFFLFYFFYVQYMHIWYQLQLNVYVCLYVTNWLWYFILAFICCI